MGLWTFNVRSSLNLFCVLWSDFGTWWVLILEHLSWLACWWLMWQLLCFSLFLLPQLLPELLGLAQICPTSAFPLQLLQAFLVYVVVSAPYSFFFPFFSMSGNTWTHLTVKFSEEFLMPASGTWVANSNNSSSQLMKHSLPYDLSNRSSCICGYISEK